jgi:hypothetical protein
MKYKNSIQGTNEIIWKNFISLKMQEKDNKTHWRLEKVNTKEVMNWRT